LTIFAERLDDVGGELSAEGRDTRVASHTRRYTPVDSDEPSTSPSTAHSTADAAR